MAARTSMNPTLLPLLTSLLAALALFAPGCDDKAAADVERVRIAGKTFFLERAIDEPTRVKGLGGRDHIAPDGGMLFVFPRPQPLYFIMRDCPIPIDVAFLDGSGRVLTIHEMLPEPPQGPGESAEAYESRLKQYSSRFASQFVVETAGGRMKEIGLKEGDVVRFDTDRLKQLARQADAP